MLSHTTPEKHISHIKYIIYIFVERGFSTGDVGWIKNENIEKGKHTFSIRF